jgi:hypothetical protein
VRPHCSLYTIHSYLHHSSERAKHQVALTKPVALKGKKARKPSTTSLAISRIPKAHCSCNPSGLGSCHFCLFLRALGLSIDQRTGLLKCVKCYSESEYSGCLFSVSSFEMHCLDSQHTKKNHITPYLKQQGLVILPTPLREEILACIVLDKVTGEIYERLVKSYTEDGVHSGPIDGLPQHIGFQCSKPGCFQIVRSMRSLKKHYRQAQAHIDTQVEDATPCTFQSVFRSSITGCPVFCCILGNDVTVAVAPTPTVKESIFDLAKRLLREQSNTCDLTATLPNWFLKQRFQEIPEKAGLNCSIIFEFLYVLRAGQQYFGFELSDTFDAVLLEIRSVLLNFYCEVDMWLDTYHPQSINSILRR